MKSIIYVITGTPASLTYPEISDDTCLKEGCHSREDLEKGPVVFRRGINFEHQRHFGRLKTGHKLRCTTCHAQVSVEEHITINTYVCFICHFKPRGEEVETEAPKTCTSCHGAPEFDVGINDITYSHEEYTKGGQTNCLKCHSENVFDKAEVEKQQCLDCHNFREYLEKYEDYYLMHETHVTEHKVECFGYHHTIQHTVPHATPTIRLMCDLCHAFPDGEIHVSKMLYMGTGGKGVEDEPSVMFLTQVDCV